MQLVLDDQIGWMDSVAVVEPAALTGLGRTEEANVRIGSIHIPGKAPLGPTQGSAANLST